MFWLAVVVLLIGIVIGLWLAAWFHRHRPAPVLPPPPSPPQKIPDRFDPPALSLALQERLQGTPADGTVSRTPAGSQVIWVDSGDEVLVHLDSLQAKILDKLVLISIDLESDQTGRTPLIVAFALGSAADRAGLVAVTDEFPRGDGRLSARWGQAVQAALWFTLLDLAQAHASERGKAPAGMSASPGVLTLRAGDPIGVAE